MSLQTSDTAFLASRKTKIADTIMARQDRIPVWSLSNLTIGIIGLSSPNRQSLFQPARPDESGGIRLWRTCP
jgi:hypothetical protein